MLRYVVKDGTKRTAIVSKIDELGIVPRKRRAKQASTTLAVLYTNGVDLTIEF
jgi:hypothetical protein